VVASSVMFEAGIRGGGATHVGRRRPAAIGAERSPHGESGHRE
jgi:hypothetical protein